MQLFEVYLAPESPNLLLFPNITEIIASTLLLFHNIHGNTLVGIRIVSFQICDLLLMKMLVSIVMIMTDVLSIDKIPKCNTKTVLQRYCFPLQLIRP